MDPMTDTEWAAMVATWTQSFTAALPALPRTLTDDEEMLRGALLAVAAMQATTNVNLPPAYACRSVEEYVLRHGAWYTPRVLPKSYKRGPMKQCFDNAYRRARRSKGRLRYVEGYAFSDIRVMIPMHHAWCVDENNEVVELTWRRPGLAYVGIEVPVDYVASIRTDANVSVLHDWPHGYPVLRGALLGGING